MNVIISNKYQDLLVNLDIDIIKTMNGEFDVQELIDTFSNFFFNKMILDITAIKEYQNIDNIQKLSMNLDMSKIVLLLDDSPESTTPSYLSKLISMGIYNFTRNVDNVKYLLDNPNTYKDVAHYHNLNTPSVEATGGMAGEPIVTSIIGFKNITDEAGATTLIYMLKKQLAENYRVLAVEIDKNDFVYFNDPDLQSVSPVDFSSKILMNSANYDVILVDLNNSDEGGCSDVVYLIEPSTIKLNKMIRTNRTIFERLKNKKIVLNKSLLDNKDVADFEYESRSQVFFNIPPLDDKINKNKILNEFCAKLGFIRQKSGEETATDNKLFNIFKK